MPSGMSDDIESNSSLSAMTSSHEASETWLNDTSHSPDNGLLCLACQTLFGNTKQHMHDDFSVVRDNQTIDESAAHGCPICLIVRDSLRETEWLRAYEPRMSIDFDSRFATFIGWGGAGLMKLLPEVTYGAPSHALDPDGQFFDKENHKVLVQSPLLSSNTGSQGCIDRMAAWLKDCVTCHESCNIGTARAPDTYPARLLEVQSTVMKLTERFDMNLQTYPAYMTLSHKWGLESMPKLLRANHTMMQEGVNVLSLPKVFQDTITLARALSIRYVWIDALCIIQDDTDDVQFEIAKMGHIYRNAILNAGCLEQRSVPEEHSSGLSIERDVKRHAPVRLKIRRADHEGDYFAYVWDFTAELEMSPLMKRGWVAQERLLSPRSIYFGAQVWWECGEQPACESFPGGFPLGDSGYGRHRLTRLLHSVPNDLYAKTSPVDKIYWEWEQISQRFTSCNLTFEQDYLPALSGIARVFRDIWHTEYHAGLFLHVSLLGLLWYWNTSHYNDEHIGPKEYRAPSWSWASLNLKIMFLANVYVQKHMIAEIIDVATIPAGHDPCSKLVGGHLTISGSLRKSDRKLSKRYREPSWTTYSDGLRQQYEWYDEGYNPDGTRTMRDCWFFLVAWSKDKKSGRVDACTLTNEAAGGRQEISDGRYSVETGHVHGLILEAIDLERSTYRSIGAFMHMWGSGRTYEYNPKPEDYPEFLDFDTENFERHTITIV